MPEKNGKSYNDVPGLQMGKGTFDFCLIGEVVPGASRKRDVVDGDLSLTPHFINAAKKLEARGVKAISGQCGFMALFQREISDAVSIPVITSSLILVPLLYRMLNKNQKVGILTINSKILSDKHFNSVGWNSKEIPVAIAGVEDMESWKIFQKEKWDFKQMRLDLMEVARKLVEEHSDIGSIVLEYTLMPPHRRYIQQATGLPVFDITILTKMVFEEVNNS